MKTTRQSLRQRRCAIEAHERREFSENLVLKVKDILENIGKIKKIALYLANDGEIDPKYIENWLKMQNIELFLPVLSEKSLKFAKIGKKFKKNRFGIGEPDTLTLLNANQMDIIFMPLVGFDEDKNRIGMGGGFYDRTLAFKKQQESDNPKLYGLAFDCQKVDKTKPQEWDVPLDAVITPTTIYR